MALFCNGYAVFENEVVDIRLLCKILNSKIMQYYISNTSYCIEGGYYCYQKKYIEKFSIPKFSEVERKYIDSASKESLDLFLLEKYRLSIPSDIIETV